MTDALRPRLPAGLGSGRGRTADAPTTRDRSTSAARTPARQKSTALTRERHAADYAILVIVVALTAIGILMVYSSSAMKAYIATDDTLSIVGPQIGWAALGMIAMAGMMRVDYRYLRFVSVPFYAFALLLLVLVFVPSLNVVVGGSARWLKLPLLPALHPAEFAEARHDHLSRPLVREARRPDPAASGPGRSRS